MSISDELHNEFEDSVDVANQDDVQKQDFSQFTKSELVDFLEQFKPEANFQEANSVLKNVRQQYDHLFEQEEQTALEKFVADGSLADDFKFKKDERSVAFDAAFTAIKEKISAHYSSLEKQKTKNSEIKNSILEQMRAIIASEESAESFQSFKKLQDTWKATGQVPLAEAKELWANYQALTDMFYNNRSVYFELKELDRRKNLSLKQEIISKVEQLLDHPNVQSAFNELRKLQDEFRNIGPVPKEDHENLWAKLKHFSDAIFAKRKTFLEDLDKAKVANHELKVALVEKLKEFEEFTTEKIDEWKVKTAHILEIQESWKKIGQVPEDKVKDLSKEFWAIGKKFFSNKNTFFKKLDDKRQENLEQKMILCEKAEALKDNQDFAETSRSIIQLQKEWAKIGQVPIKFKDTIFARFKSACDYFFQQQRDLKVQAESALIENLKNKEAYLKELQTKVKSTVVDTEETLLSYIDQWETLGFVPMEQKKALQDSFRDVLFAGIEKMPLDSEAKEKLQLKIEVKQGGTKNVEGLMKDLQRKAATVKAEIEQYNNNMAFFANSTKASALKEQVQTKISEAELELKKLLAKINILKG
ncbi:DUF349 domain-containing protein [uncultured Cytophaga sp.]|uniref:DUF349 domain-containing protein n=1 Tax=uncultured Cytophaga sp. TaxID=160238 RepID=UPI002620922E|nr:DUF349 domain-containing protein [uncultured Cytophaga sp.]